MLPEGNIDINNHLKLIFSCKERKDELYNIFNENRNNFRNGLINEKEWIKLILKKLQQD